MINEYSLVTPPGVFKKSTPPKKTVGTRDRVPRVGIDIGRYFRVISTSTSRAGGYR